MEGGGGGAIHPSIYQKVLYWKPNISLTQFNRYYSPVGESALLLNCKSCCSSAEEEKEKEKAAAAAAAPGSPSTQSESDKIKVLALTGIAKTAVAPFERVKLLMQSQNELLVSARLSRPYHGIFDCFARTIRNEGFLSLWRGNIALTYTHLTAQLTFHGLFQLIIKRGVNDTSNHLTAATGVAAAANLFLLYPFLYAGTRLANDVKTNTRSRWQFNGIFDVFSKTLKADGVAGVYRGYSMALAQLGFLTFLCAATDPWRRLLLYLLQDSPHTSKVVDLGFNVGIVLGCHPIDTVSRRMMMTSGEAVRYKSPLNAVTQIYKFEGSHSFYKGARANVLLTVAFYGNALLITHLLHTTITWKSSRDIN